MEKITLFHGTSSRIVVPTYGLGEKKHDYGKGFYLTDNLNLAKEWAVCKPNDENGWVHCSECPLVISAYELMCKANASYDRRARAWEYDDVEPEE